LYSGRTVPPAQLRHDLQLLDFGFAVQAVAALALDRRDPEGQHGVEPLESGRNQLLARSAARGANGAEDAAAALQDVHVAVALQPPGVFFGPIAAEDEVGVGVDEPRQDGLAGGVDDGESGKVPAGRAQPGHHGRRRPHARDLAVFDDHRPVGDDAEIGHGPALLRRKSAAGDEFGGVF
jgi:hypothetical protein